MGVLTGVGVSGQVTHTVKRIRVQNDWASLMAQMVKNPSAMWEIWVQSLDWEDPLEKRMATQSSILV